MTSQLLSLLAITDIHHLTISNLAYESLCSYDLHLHSFPVFLQLAFHKSSLSFTEQILAKFQVLLLDDAATTLRLRLVTDRKYSITT